MHSRCVRAAALALLALFVAMGVLPSASALVPSDNFATSVQATTIDTESSDVGTDLLANLTLLTGRMEWDSERRGVYGFIGAESFEVTDLDRVQVFNQTEISESIRQRRLPSEAAVHEFSNARIDASTGSNLVVMANDVRVRYDCRAEFTIALPIVLPEDLVNESVVDVPAGASMLSTGPGQSCTMAQANETRDSGMFLIDDTSSVTVTDGTGQTMDFTGREWVFRFFGKPHYESVSNGALTPFHTSGKATLRPYNGADIQDRFSLQALADVVDAVSDSTGEGGSATDPSAVADMEEQIRPLAPILDGVLSGNVTAAVEVNGDFFHEPGLSVVRFDSLGIVPMGADQWRVAGQSKFILVEGQLYAEAATFDAGPLSIPILSGLIWLAAVGAIVASILLKPFVGAENVKAYGLLRLIAFAFHILALITAFILWDLEVRTMLGASLLGVFGSGATGQGTALAVIGAIQLISFGLAWVFFALPMRFIANGALKLGGLKKAKGLGKGVGNLAQWGIGALFLQAILAGLMATVFGMVGDLLA